MSLEDMRIVYEEHQSSLKEGSVCVCDACFMYPVLTDQKAIDLVATQLAEAMDRMAMQDVLR